jgi:3-oxoacyl-[acyl-carrier-protein] synthase-3
MGSRLAGVEVHLPERCLSSTEVEALVGPYRPSPGLLARLTGIRSRHVAAADEQASDLAAAAARKLLAGTGTAPDEVDLLLFASASQDLVEPATAHIVAAALGLACPVMDVKNACNSVLNACEVADALIRTGRYRTVLVASGETPSRAVRWEVGDLRAVPAQLRRLHAVRRGRGAARAPRPTGPAWLGFGFTADSRHWGAGTLGAGGSRHPRDVEHTYFAMDAAALKAAFLDVGTGVLDTTLHRLGIGWDDCAVVAVHQVSLPYLQVLRRPGRGAAGEAGRHRRRARQRRLGQPAAAARHRARAGPVRARRPRRARRAGRRGVAGTRGWWSCEAGAAGGGGPGLRRGRRHRRDARRAGRAAGPRLPASSSSTTPPPTAPVTSSAPSPPSTADVVAEAQRGTGAAAGHRDAARHRRRGHPPRAHRRRLPARPGLDRRGSARRSAGSTWCRGGCARAVTRGCRRRSGPVLVGAVGVASAFGRFRPGNRVPGALGPYVMAAGCNMAITAELYERAGGLPAHRASRTSTRTARWSTRCAR